MHIRLSRAILFPLSPLIVAISAFASSPMPSAATNDSPPSPHHGFGQAGALRLVQGEELISAAVIDPTRSFAYFGTGTSPGMVIKVDLATFTRVDALSLNDSQTKVASAVIDANAGFAYFGTDTFPGKVIKVDLATFSVVDTLTLDPGEDRLWTSVIDTAKGYAYFTTHPNSPWDKDPGSVVKVRLTTLTRVGTFAFDKSESDITSAVIDSTHQFAYFGSGSGRIVKLDLATFTRVSDLDLGSDENHLSCALVDPSKELAYFITEGSPSKMIKIDLATFTKLGTITLEADERFVSCAFIDTAGAFAYLATGWYYTIVVKVDLKAFKRVSAVNTSYSALFPTSAILDPTRRVAYFGTWTSPAQINRLDLDTFTEQAPLALVRGENFPNAATIDVARGFAYFGTWMGPDQFLTGEFKPRECIVKIDLATFTRVGSLILDTDDYGVTSATTDQTHNVAYFGTFNGTVIKVDLATFQRVGTLRNMGGELVSTIIDEKQGFLYFGSSSGEIVKIDLSSFTKVGTLRLGTSSLYLTCAVIDPARGLAFFGSHTSPGKVMKVDLATFTLLDTVILEEGENDLSAAIIDPIAGSAYFVSFTSPGKIVRLNLHPFHRVDALKLSELTWPGGLEYRYLGPPVIDTNTGIAYFGSTTTQKPHILKIDLDTFALVGEIGLAEYYSSPTCAVINPSKGLAYFGAYTHPGEIISIDLGNTKTRVSSSRTSSHPRESVTFSATVGSLAKDGGVPSGKVTFKDNDLEIPGCTDVSLDASGHGICSTASLTTGDHVITVEYSGSGDGSFNRSQGILTHNHFVGDDGLLRRPRP